MKKSILTASLMILLACGVKAQDFLIGGGMVYGTFRENVGFDFRGDLRFSSGWAVVPHLTAYVPDYINNSNVRIGFREINLDAHYLFNVEQLNFYPLAGLNFGTTSWKDKRTDYLDRKTEIGINLGGGAEYFFTNKVAGLFETKYVVGDYDQWVLTFGVLVKLTH